MAFLPVRARRNRSISPMTSTLRGRRRIFARATSKAPSDSSSKPKPRMHRATSRRDSLRISVRKAESITERPRPAPAGPSASRSRGGNRRLDDLRAELAARFDAIDHRLGQLEAAIRASTRSLVPTMIALFAVAVPVWTAASALMVCFLVLPQ